MNIITPEIIFDRFASRLYERWDDLDYIIHAESGFEKWAQWELFLCFTDELVPVVYKQDGNFLLEDGEDDGEFIADIRLEYSYDRENGNAERADFFIAKKPFIYNKVDLDTWEILESKNEDDLRKDYKNLECHYVELKTDWWDLREDGKDPEETEDPKVQPKGLIKDIEKKIKEDGNGSIPDEWKPCSLIAMSIVTFWDSKAPNKTVGKEKVMEKIGDLRTRIANLGLDEFLYSHIEDDTYLIGAYRLLPESNSTPAR